jgi:hypothetical protein
MHIRLSLQPLVARVRAILVAGVVVAAPVVASTQTLAPPPTRPDSPPASVNAPAAPQVSSVRRTVEGRVQRPTAPGVDSANLRPVGTTWVTLHRVGRDTAGPIDSMRTDANGRYRFTWRPFGNADAVYFASVTWGGIAYFTAPLRATDARGDEAEITVFDTTSRTFPLLVKGRHLIVGQADSTDMRTVIEVFELSNDSARTLVTAEGASPSPTWTVSIPQAAQDVRVTQGEISPDAFSYAAGRVSVFAPIAPGLKQIAFSYKMPVASFPFTARAEHGAVVFEVLIEEPQGSVIGAGFAAVDPVTLEKRNFRRFLAQDVKDGSVATIELPASKLPGRNLYIAGLLVAIGFLMLLVLSRAMQRRTNQASALSVPGPLRARVAPRVADAPLHERLAQEIAALDATFARQVAPSESVRTAYDARRAELKDALNEALASVQASR